MHLWVGASALGAGQGNGTALGGVLLLTFISAMHLSQAPAQRRAYVLGFWFHSPEDKPTAIGCGMTS